MSDRYLYKAKRTDNGEWVEGYYANCYFPNGDNSDVRTGHFIIEYPGEYHEIYTESLCQCPGYKGIWEHDIFQCDEDRYQIEFSEESLTWRAESIFSSESIELGEFAPEEIDVIGNIFDNPELLEVEHDT